MLRISFVKIQHYLRIDSLPNIFATKEPLAMASPKVKSLMQVIRKAGLTRSELRELEEEIFRIQSHGVAVGQVVHDLPPKMPQEAEALNRAICLLGNRMMADLKGKGHQELTNLIGIYPSLEQASAWKQTLTKQYREMTASTDPSQKSIAPAAKSTVPAAKSAVPAAKSAVPAAKSAVPAAKSIDKTEKKRKTKLSSVQERFEQFNEEADFLDRIGLGHLAAKMNVSDPRD
jgi:hypothetical protein